MKLSIKELNELIYSLGTTANKGMMCDKELNASLLDKLYCELNYRIGLEAIDEEIDEPEFDSAGFSFEDREPQPHYVSNEEADEDAFTDHLLGADLDYIASVEQDGQRYDDSHMSTSFPIVDPFTSVSDDYRIHLRKLKTRGYASQALLDYVDRMGAVTHKELERYYKQITGSNSFSHVLQNLRIPYKNRKTQRYLAKEGRKYSDAKYIVKLANPSNWVVVND